MDDVIFAHKPRLLDIAAQLKRSAYAALGLAINSTSCRPTDARDYFWGAYSNCPDGNNGAESAVHDCLVICFVYQSQAGKARSAVAACVSYDQPGKGEANIGDTPYRVIFFLSSWFYTTVNKALLAVENFMKSS